MKELPFKVIKRDGREVEFDVTKIYDAMMKAFREVRSENLQLKTEARFTSMITEIGSDVSSALLIHDMTVEDIQNVIENRLNNEAFKDVYEAYHNYRKERTVIRNKKSDLMKLISSKIDATDIDNQNANVDEMSFGGRKGEADSALFKDYALNYCMSEMSRNNHLNNEIYIHDLDSYAIGDGNCLSVPFDDLLKNGFNTRQTDVRPAQSVNTAFQLVAVIFQIQSLQQFGGCSATHLDWTMVPYVRKSFYKHYMTGIKYIHEFHNRLYDEWIDAITDSNPIDEYPDCYSKVYEYAMDMTIKETNQAVEGMFHNLNTLQSRSGNQLPFSSINFGTCTKSEGRIVIKAILEASIKGVGKLHRTPIFPCSIFQYMKGVNDKPDTPNYDMYRLALKSTALRLYPNYCNCDWSNNAGYDKKDPRTYVATMGCRTYNGYDINGFKQIKDGRGNICPVTIILPTLAMEARESSNGENVVDLFMKILDKKIGEAKDMLIERFDYICKQSPDSAKFMYENNVMYGYVPEEGIRSALKHGTLAIGQLGLAETLQALVGFDQTTSTGMKLAKRIESLFNERCKEFKEKYKLNFGVYYTPAENACHTAMDKFKAKYGEIKNVSDHEFFTNSMHVPVWDKVSVFDKIDIESQLTGYSNAGCITYVELDGDVKNNIDALETIVNYAMDKDIPYFAINIPNDMCVDCGYIGDIGDVCPACGSKKPPKRLKRVTGYLTGDYESTFNVGKKQEAEMRVRHTGNVVTID